MRARSRRCRGAISGRATNSAANWIVWNTALLLRPGEQRSARLGDFLYRPGLGPLCEAPPHPAPLVAPGPPHIRQTHQQLAPALVAAGDERSPVLLGEPQGLLRGRLP